MSRSILTCLVLALGPSGCGYGFQNTHNPLLEKYHVHRIFLEPMANNTLKPGVENLVYNEVLRGLSGNPGIEVVQSRDSADAVLHGVVVNARYLASAQTAGSQLVPLKSDGTPALGSAVTAQFSNITVASLYNAVLECHFALGLANPDSTKPDIKGLWSLNLSRAHTFPGNNQLGDFGSTAALINDSEFDRATRDNARSMAGDLHDAITAAF